jgi:hypothetical protein
MKYFVKILSLMVVIIGFTACGSSQKLVETLPFTIGEMRIEPWSVGESTHPRGVNIYIPVQDLDPEITLDSLYYKGDVAKLESVKRDSYHVFIGRFMEKRPANLVLHQDPKKEFGNKPTQGKIKPPYNIGKEQALLKYNIKGSAEYYKLSDFKPSVPTHYRELPPSLK